MIELKKIVRTSVPEALQKAEHYRLLDQSSDSESICLDILEIDGNILPLGALCWAAAGKDPGFTPLSLLDLLRRRGKYRPEDFSRLHLAKPVYVRELKERWLAMLDRAERFIRSRPADEMGCLYYSPSLQTFVAPSEDHESDAVLHYGRPGGVLPRVVDEN